MKTIRLGLFALMVTLLAALTLAGCGGGDRSEEPTAAQREGASAGEAADEGGSDSGNASGSGGAPNEASGQPPARQVKVEPNPGRAIAYTATLRVRAKNVDEAGSRAKQLVSAAGGHVENERAAGSSGRIDLTFKIPSDKYPATLDQLTTELGTKLELRQEAEDVTEEVADVNSRVRSAEATLASFRKLLDRAKTIGEVINVEQEIERRQADLEALQARQKSLAQRTQYATLTLELSGPVQAVPPPPDEDERGGFLGGLERGWDAFTAVVSGLALTLGVLLPFLVTGAVLAIPGYLLARRTILARRRSA